MIIYILIFRKLMKNRQAEGRGAVTVVTHPGLPSELLAAVIVTAEER